jgi:hypothetical protein
MSAKLHEASPDQAELFLAGFTDRKARQDYLRDNSLAGYQLLKLKLKIDDTLGPIQNIRDYNVGGTVDQSVEYALKLMTEQGRIPNFNTDEKLPLLEGPFDQLPPDAWCSPVFGQIKPGRVFPDTDLQLVRVLNDMRNTNSAIDMTYYSLWHVCNPTRESIVLRIPPEASWFGEVDLKDSFHYGLMHEDSRKYMWIHFKRRFYNWRGVPQGLAPASLYFQALITDLLNHAIGLSWQLASIPCVVIWTDALMPMGDTEERTRIRQDIIIDILTVAGFAFSPKCKFNVSQEGQMKVPQ